MFHFIRPELIFTTLVKINLVVIIGFFTTQKRSYRTFIVNLLAYVYVKSIGLNAVLLRYNNVVFLNTTTCSCYLSNIPQYVLTYCGILDN